MAQIKKIITIADVEPAMKELKELDSELRGAHEDLANRIAAIRDEFAHTYQDDLDRREALENMIAGYADANKKELFDGQKSREFPSGTISLRTGPLAVALKKGVTISEVALTAAVMRLSHIIRTIRELDKNAVKDEIKAGHLNADGLKKLGVVATQSETINIKLNDQ